MFNVCCQIYIRFHLHRSFLSHVKWNLLCDSLQLAAYIHTPVLRYTHIQLYSLPVIVWMMIHWTSEVASQFFFIVVETFTKKGNLLLDRFTNSLIFLECCLLLRSSDVISST